MLQLIFVKYGGDIAVGAMTILTSVMQFAMLPLQGLGQGAQPILSYNYGAKNVDRVRGTFRLLLKVSVGYAVILWLCVELFPQIFVSMFTSDAALLAFSKDSHFVYIWQQCLCLESRSHARWDLPLLAAHQNPLLWQ